MISEEKVKLMTALARYDKNEGASDLQIYRYNRNDFVRMESLKVGLAVSIAYLIGVLIFIGIRFEWVLDMVESGTVAILVVCLFLFYCVIYILYMKYIGKKTRKHYGEVTIRVKAYEKKLEDLLSIYEEEEQEDNRPELAAKESEHGTDIII